MVSTAPASGSFTLKVNSPESPGWTGLDENSESTGMSLIPVKTKLSVVVVTFPALSTIVTSNVSVWVCPWASAAISALAPLDDEL